MSAPRELLFEGEPLTAREVRIARHAFNDGALYGRGPFVNSAASAAAAQYPLPKVTRPRVARDPSGVGEWSVAAFHGTPAIYWRHSTERNWEAKLGILVATSERVKLWADLLEHPTEEVDAE